MRKASTTVLLSGIACIMLGLVSFPLGAEDSDGSSHKWFDPALFHDPNDGSFDVSAWLASRYGFMPVPIIITGPTLGNGGGLNLLFMQGKLDGQKAPNGRHVPPNITGVAAVATSNGSRMGGAYNKGFWKEDRLRTTTFVGRSDINLDFYPDILGRESTVTMNLEGWAFYQQALVRVGESDFLLGGSYAYSTLDSSPVHHRGPVVDQLTDRSYQVGGLGAVLQYDSRDTIFTPTRGAFGEVVATLHAGWLGSDDDFMSYHGKLFEYLHLSRDFDLGLRGEGHSVGSDAPYFLYPSVQIRGIADARYQGQHVIVGETELSWRVHDRWHLVGFAGSGKAFGGNKLKDRTAFSDAVWRSSKGLGLRYEIARAFGLQVGADVAWGPEDTAFYITVGSAWNSFF